MTKFVVMNKDKYFQNGGFINHNVRLFYLIKGESVIAKKMIIRPEDLKYMLQLEDIARKAKSKDPIVENQYQKVIKEINEKAKIQDN